MSRYFRILSLLVAVVTAGNYFIEQRLASIAVACGIIAAVSVYYLVLSWLQLLSMKRNRMMFDLEQPHEELQAFNELYWTVALFALWVAHFVLILHFMPMFGVFLASIVAVAFTVLLYNLVKIILIFRTTHQRLRAVQSDQEGDDNETTNF